MTPIFAISSDMNPILQIIHIYSELMMNMQDRILIPVSGSEEYVAHLTKGKSNDLVKLLRPVLTPLIRLEIQYRCESDNTAIFANVAI